MDNEKEIQKPPLNILLAAPRGFCAGVDRAKQIVERALELYGKPIYVRHEIVHNRFVVDQLKSKGTIFVENLEEIPDDSYVIFSAHGVPKSVVTDAQNRGLKWIDGTCPLVSKVHIEAAKYHQENKHILLIGHKNHPEVIGTIGQLPVGAIELIETIEDAQNIIIKTPKSLAYITQTTLAIDDTYDIIKCLKKRFPHITAPHKEDICYATTNRQKAVKVIVPKVDALYVIGAHNSSNSIRLVETAKKLGCKNAELIASAEDIDITKLKNIKNIGITAGASAPEILVQQTIKRLESSFEIKITEHKITNENVEFKLPKVLR